MSTTQQNSPHSNTQTEWKVKHPTISNSEYFVLMDEVEFAISRQALPIEILELIWDLGYEIVKRNKTDNNSST